MRCLELGPTSMFWADSKGSGVEVNRRSDPLAPVVYSCTDDCTAPHRTLSGESPLAKMKNLAPAVALNTQLQNRKISELQTPHQSKLQICCYIIHHIYITLKNPKAIFLLPPRFPKKATWYHSMWRANSEISLVQNILWSSTPVFQFYSYCEKSPTPNTFHSNTSPLPCKACFLSWVSGYKMEWNHVWSIYAQLQRRVRLIWNCGCLLILHFCICIAVANRKQNSMKFKERKICLGLL